MNPDTGEVRKLTSAELAGERKQVDGKRYIKVNGSWWLEAQVEPSPFQLEHGMKGHHPCLCGSGKRYRNCCRGKQP